MSKKNIMAIWKEFNPDVSKSIKEDFAKEPSPYLDKIIEYLNNGEVLLASSSCAVDVFTGAKIAGSRCILTDGEYSWNNTLAYYVKEYNLQIPEELEEKIVGKMRKYQCESSN